jgi:hypothetical protein
LQKVGCDCCNQSVLIFVMVHIIWWKLDQSLEQLFAMLVDVTFACSYALCTSDLSWVFFLF